MGFYKDAAGLLIKRQFGIYGPERVKIIAKESGYAVDNSGNILAVGDEEKAFKNLWMKIDHELGPVAKIGSKVTVMRFFMTAGVEMPSWLG